MSSIRPALAAALEILHAGARLETLPGDASTRRFHRLILPDGGTRIVMDYGATFEGETDDVRLARIFERAALPVARVLEVLPEAGCLILEDLGDVTLEAALTRAENGRGVPRRDDLYRGAIELAAAVATRGTASLLRSDRAAGPALDEERFLFEMRFFVDNFVVRLLGRTGASPGITSALEALAREASAHPRVLCHRDFHSRNLMVQQDGRLAMVDIQDARWGPDTYDVASLLRDAYVDIEEGEVSELLELYRLQRPETPDEAQFRDRFHVVAAQRMIKALGTFGYQIAMLERSRYRSAVPRTLDRLARVLPTHDSTRQLADALESEGIY
jgi:aminoglycoside/choline kinase family phosphotransferase